MAIVLLGAVLRVHQLGHKGFWGDEIWSAQRSGMSARQIIDFSLNNTLGPWTYLAGNASLSLLGTEHLEFVTRLPSVLAGILTIPMAWALAHRLWGRTTGLVAALLVALSPYQVWYSQEARYYAWVTLFALGATYFIYRAYQEPRRASPWMGFAAAIIAGIYNHPLSAVLALAGLVPFMLIYGLKQPGRRERLAGLFGSAVAVGLACLPLVLRTATVGQINTQDPTAVLLPSPAGWLPALGDVLIELWQRFGAAGWGQWLFLACAMMGVLALILRRQWSHLVLLLSPFIFSTLFFALWELPFILRYLLFLQPLYLLLASWGIVALGIGLGIALAHPAHGDTVPTRETARHRGALLLPATILAVLTTLSLLTTAKGYAVAKPNDWRSMAAYLEERIEPGDLVLVRYGWAADALEWYLELPEGIDLASLEKVDLDAVLWKARRAWYIPSVEEPIHPYSRRLMEMMSPVPDREWQDPSLRYEEGFFPVSELPGQLFFAEIGDSWLRFEDIAGASWTDRSYTEIPPGDEVRFTLRLPGDRARELLLVYYDLVGKELEVSTGEQTLGVIGGKGGGWTTAHLALPDTSGETIEIRVRAIGSSNGGISEARVREVVAETSLP